MGNKILPGAMPVYPLDGEIFTIQLDAGQAMDVDIVPLTNIVGGQITLTGAAQNLNDASATKTIVIQNPAGNNPVSILDTATQAITVHILDAEKSIPIDISSPNNVYISGTALETVYWMGLT